MTEGSLTVAQAVATLAPSIPRRELARRLKGIPPDGYYYGPRGRPAKTYLLTDIFRAHAEWVAHRRTVGDT